MRGHMRARGEALSAGVSRELEIGLHRGCAIAHLAHAAHRHLPVADDGERVHAAIVAAVGELAAPPPAPHPARVPRGVAAPAPPAPDPPPPPPPARPPTPDPPLPL